MKNNIKIPRILKIKSINGFIVSCIFNNGELRDIDFQQLFSKWKLVKTDPEWSLKDSSTFKKLQVRNNTLSWNNIRTSIIHPNGKEVFEPLELDPVELFKHSVPNKSPFKKFNLGPVIRKERLSKGFSQDELANRSGTSKTYISRLENNLIEPELHTLYKIVEIGLGKKIELKIS